MKKLPKENLVGFWVGIFTVFIFAGLLFAASISHVGEHEIFDSTSQLDHAGTVNLTGDVVRFKAPVLEWDILVAGVTITNGLASTNFVTGQGYVTATVTNGLASTNFVTGQGYVTATVTNGLASTNFVTGQGYVTATVTNGLASTNFVTGQGYVTQTVTNGLASQSFVTTQGYPSVIVTNVMADFPNTAATGFAELDYPLAQAITNMVVSVGRPAAENGNAMVTGRVSSNGFITLKLQVSSVLNPANLPYRIMIFTTPTQ